MAPHHGSLIAGAVLVALVAAMEVALPWPLKVIVDDVLKQSPVKDDSVVARSGLSDLATSELLWVCLMALALFTVLNAAATYWGSRVLGGVGEKVTAAIRSDVFTHLQRLSLSFHDRQRLGDLMVRTTTDVEYVQGLLVSMLSVLVPNVLVLGFITAICFLVDPAFAFIALAVAPLLFVTVVVYRRRIKAASRSARSKDSDIASTVSETFSSVRVMQCYTTEGHHEAGFRFRNLARMNAGLRVVRLQSALSPLVDVIVAGGTVLVLWVGAHRVLNGTMSLGLLLVFLAYLKALYDPMKALAKLTTIVSRGQASAERLSQILDTAPLIVDRPSARPAPPLTGAVELRGVGFGYSDDSAVLTGIDLHAAAGEMVAITGPTGAGKSSIISLIPRLYEVRQGAVLLDGADVRDLQLETVRSQISLVLQDAVLFRGTIYDNIAYGAEGVTREQVLSAARAAHVEEFVQSLPLGYETLVAERGVSLSGGQRQRIAIARALVRDTPIVILDEPTSGLDAISEQYVMQGLDRLMKGRTVFVIAHRLSTLRRADRIYVIDGGRIVETGRHQDLIGAGGLYSRLDSLQHIPSTERHPALSLLPTGTEVRA
ncbi:MAG: ABC transporter ATP-binding protein [Ornithinibacter sp.]